VMKSCKNFGEHCRLTFELSGGTRAQPLARPLERRVSALVELWLGVA
jgi:hypothetical protein